MPTPIRWPDLSERPFSLSVERRMKASPADLYRAWTREFDRWFAAPGSVLMRPEVDAPFFFETEFRYEDAAKAARHPHYGRFLQLEPDRLVEMTWVTGPRGTDGAETVVRVAFSPLADGALVKLSHSGFLTTAARDQHEEAWPLVLEQQEQALARA